MYIFVASKLHQIKIAMLPRQIPIILMILFLNYTHLNPMAGLHSKVPLLCGTSTLLRGEDGFVDNVDDELSAGQDCWHPG
jgi:hypothetical protein